MVNLQLLGISSANTFFVSGPSVDPGTFNNNTSLRTQSLPTFQRSRTKDTFFVYDVETLREYVSGEQDGIYYLTVVDSSNTPVVNLSTTKISSPSPHQSENSILSMIETILSLTPNLLKTYSKPTPLGDVSTDDPRNSITKRIMDTAFLDFGVGVGITDIISNPTGTATPSLPTSITVSTVLLRLSVLYSVVLGYGNGTGVVENLYNLSPG